MLRFEKKRFEKRLESDKSVTQEERRGEEKPIYIVGHPTKNIGYKISHKITFSLIIPNVVNKRHFRLSGQNIPLLLSVLRSFIFRLIMALKYRDKFPKFPKLARHLWAEKRKSSKYLS